MYTIFYFLFLPTTVFGFTITNVAYLISQNNNNNNNARYSNTCTWCEDNTCTLISNKISPIKSKWIFQMSLSKDDNIVDAEIVNQDDDEDKEWEEEFDWIPDREKARMAREATWKRAEANPSSSSSSSFTGTGRSRTENENREDSISSDDSKRAKRLVYTDEEEELISSLGGKDPSNPSPKREDGFLGDSTLREISMDFQVPICYLADVLCGWGVPPPIDPNTLLGDMITGEQAFAILEAIHTLDVGSLNDRYADYDLQTLCFEYDIDLSDGFEMAMKEGWNLPFGVRTFLRVEQEEHLIETLAKDIW